MQLKTLEFVIISSFISGYVLGFRFEWEILEEVQEYKDLIVRLLDTKPKCIDTEKFFVNTLKYILINRMTYAIMWIQCISDALHPKQKTVR